MDKFTLKADKVVQEYTNPGRMGMSKMDKGIQNLATAAKLATSLGATPERRSFRRSGVKKLNKAMDGVLSKLANKIKSLESEIK